MASDEKEADILESLSVAGKAKVMRLIRRLALRGRTQRLVERLPDDIHKASVEVLDAFETELNQGFEEWT